jgi:hypothetical protein
VNKVEGVSHGDDRYTMPTQLRIWSKAYASSSDPDPYSVQIDKSLWEHAFRRTESRRMFLRIQHPLGIQDWITPIGAPVTSEEEEEPYNVYLPLWMMDSAQLGGQGDSVIGEILDEEAFPQATRIVLRVVDSAFYNADVKDELEKALSSLGVIQAQTTLQIPITALGGFAVEVFVSETEPANVILCDGEEVAVEFEEPVDQVEPPRPPTPIPEIPLPLLAPESLPEPEGFRAFQGSGQRLGGSNAEVPEWRRGLAPPPRR